MKKTLALIASIIFLFASSAYADRAVTLPWELTFDNNAWVADLARGECGGTSTHVTEGCYSGGCMKVVPPPNPCAAGINGGGNGLRWITYPATSRIHIRFLVKFGPTFASSMRNSGGNLEIKFLVLDSPSRVGLLGLLCSDTDGRYCAFAAYGNGNVWTFRNATPVWIEYAPFRVSDRSRSNEWIAVEYWVDSASDRTGVYVWTRDGAQSGSIVDVAKSNSVNSTGFWMSYYNSIGVANAGDWYLIDNLAVSNQYIGPPAGFVGGTPPAACSYTYYEWGACQPNGTQTRTVNYATPSGCVGTPVLSQSCTYVPPVVPCAYNYSAWGACENGAQTRVVVSSSPADCTGTPVLAQTCSAVPGVPGPPGPTGPAGPAGPKGDTGDVKITITLPDGKVITCP